MDASSARLADSEVWQTSEKALSCTTILFKTDHFFHPCGGDPMKGRSSQEGKVSRKNDAADAYDLSARLIFSFFPFMDASSARLADSEVWQTSEKALSCTTILSKTDHFFRPCGGDPMKGRSSQEGKVSRKNDAADAYDLSARLICSFFSFHGCLVCSPRRLKGLADLRESAFLYYNPI
jgi:hypothetical protein